MFKKISILFNKEIAVAFDELTEILNDIFTNLKSKGLKVEWCQERELSYYGFKLFSNSKQRHLFVGMYYNI